ncbi:MAG: hypothetical protein F9K30_12805 [Dechloromonas sp.]|nr:MAG: hypothetical protein F9K30_12805 [Dechloromonas sp.]
MDTAEQENGATEGKEAAAGEAPRIDPLIDGDRRIRQAIVVIHGIGEQRPMATLRGFVDAVLAGSEQQNPRYRSKPDAMSTLLETRCLQAPRTRDRPLTDFYEFYWAHHMRDSRYTQVIGWLFGLVSRPSDAIPPGLRAVYWLSRGLLLGGFGCLVWALVVEIQGIGQPAGVSLADRWPLVAGLGAIVLQWLGSTFVLGYVADAARYLHPEPGNIEARNKIRSEGVKLLKTLHASGKYRRIVIVGHSLGSVIGYDLIRTLWTDLRKPVVPFRCKQRLLKEFQEMAAQLRDGGVSLEDFQQSQHALWQEFRAVGIPWLITDFITLGSPLAHAQLLMADDTADFARKKLEYEFPTCPPNDSEPLAYRQNYRLANDGGSALCSVSLPHHGAPFSCVRWSNLYFPHSRLIFGDLVGGPLAPVFGAGVRDIPVRPCTDSWLDTTLVSHVKYWAGALAPNIRPRPAIRPSLNALVSALRLDFLRGRGARIGPGDCGQLPEPQGPAAGKDEGKGR